MFRQVTACILLAAISLQILNKAFVYIDYYANAAAYARNCENKARPLMHCNGKCQMMKKLRQEEKKDGQVPAERRSIQDDAISSKSSFTTLTHLHSIQIRGYNMFTVSGAVEMPRFCFHPPGAQYGSSS